MTAKFDPKLKEAAEEIKAVIRKHDIAGVVGLFSETHSEFVNEVSPSWSAAYITGDELRVRAKRTDFNTEEQHRKVVTNSVQLVMAIQQVASVWYSSANALGNLLMKKFDVDFQSSEMFPHEGG